MAAMRTPEVEAILAPLNFGVLIVGTWLIQEWLLGNSGICAYGRGNCLRIRKKIFISWPGTS